jgi:L-idonate 5-dehydrogenase
MKALYINQKLDISVVEKPIPEPADSEVRVKISHFGICGSDLHYYYEGANGAFVVKEPLMPGHEVAGYIDLDPSGEFEKGSAVTIHPATFGKSEAGIENQPHLWPGGAYLGSASTWPHTQGAAAEYVVFRKDMVRVLPLNLTTKVAALAEPLAVGLHAINVAGGVSGKKIFVSGSGPIGLLLIAAAKSLGASEIASSDLLDGPLARAKNLGADTSIKIGTDVLPENYFDIVFECSGVARAISGALTTVRRGGIVVQVGMLGAGGHEIAIAPLVSKEIQLRGTFRFRDEIDVAIKMLADNPWIASTITHTYSLHDAVEAFAMAKNSEESGKVLIELL